MADGDNRTAVSGEVEEQDAAAAEPQPPRPRLRLSRRGIAVIVALCAALLGVLVWLVWFSSVFDVRTTTVTGTKVLTTAQITAAAQVPYGGPVESLDTGAIAARIEKALPRVDRADVSTSFPHTVRIRITERVPVAAIKGGDGRFTQVDAGGVRFATEAKPPAGVPVVELDLSAAGRAALPQFPEAVLVNGAVEVAKSLPAAVASRTRVLAVHSFDDIELQLSGGPVVAWGSPENNARKAAVLSALIRHKGNRYDVSSPDSPAIRG